MSSRIKLDTSIDEAGLATVSGTFVTDSDLPAR